MLLQKFYWLSKYLVLLGCFLLSGGCLNSPTRIKPPEINVDTAAEEAMALYDQDKDGELSKSELESVPALKNSLSRLDKDSSQSVSKDEIKTRLSEWGSTRVGLMAYTAKVTLNGEPLANAEIEFKPLSFLGDNFISAGGTTNRQGIAIMAIPEDKRPNPNIRVIQAGFYSISVSKKIDGEESIAKKYNQNTTLGCEVSSDMRNAEVLIELQ